jgi:hypothetical protein
VPGFLRDDLKTSDLSQGLCPLSQIPKRCVSENLLATAGATINPKEKFTKI